METEFRQEEIERLVAFERKFGKEGLTFDDVLLLPAESHVLPNDVSTVTRLTPSIALNIPVDLGRDGHRHRGAPRDRAGARGRPRDRPPQPLDRGSGRRGGQGEALRVGDDRRAGHARAPTTRSPRRSSSWSATASPGVPITDDAGVLVGILTNRDLRFETDASQPVSALMTSRNLVTAPVGHDARGGRGDPPPQQDREAAGRRRGRTPEGPHHRQGHLQADQVPGRDEGRAGPPPRRRRRRCRLGRDGARGALVDAEVDVLVVDTAHGHSHGVLDVVRQIEGGARRRAHRGEHLDAARARSRWPTREPTRSRSGRGLARSARRGSSPASAYRRSPPSTTRSRRSRDRASR